MDVNDGLRELIANSVEFPYYWDWSGSCLGQEMDIDVYTAVENKLVFCGISPSLWNLWDLHLACDRRFSGWGFE